MFGMNHGLSEQLKQKHQERALMDGIDEVIEQIEFDPISEKKAISDIANMRMAALWVVMSTAKIVSETDADDEEALLPSEVLDGLTLEAIDTEDDETDVDGVLKATLTAHIADAFSTLGVEDGVIEDLFSVDYDVADSAIESAVETVLDNLPEEGEPLDQLFDEFAYGDDAADEDETDEVMMDKLAVGKTTTKKVGGRSVKYKAVRAVRNGKVVIKNKRIGGRVVLSAKQKAALRKARSKARTGSANTRRLRSVEKGIRKGIYGKSLQKNKGLLKMAKSGT